MRILMVSEDLPAAGMGGLARHVLALARALIAEGHAVDLMGNDDVALSDAGDEFSFGGRFFAELHGQFDGWKEMTLGVFMPPKRSAIARRFARAILRRAPDYDAIHYHGHVPNLARHIPPQVNFIQTRHDQGSDCLIHTRFREGQICRSTDPADCARCRAWRPNPLQRQVSALAVRRFRNEVMQGFRRHKTVFVSDLLQRNLQRSFGARGWGITVHNFVELDPLRSARTFGLRAPELASPGPVRVFIAAKLYPAKGVGAFLEALARHPAHGCEIDIAGDGGEEDILRQRFPGVRFHGWQSGPSNLALAARAHAVVVPSVCEEACPTTVLEAMLLGKTVFALRLGGTPELAMYECGPDQLRLYDSMQDLVEALLTFAPRPDYPLSPRTPTGATLAAGRLLALYRLPPGPIAAP
jgi:glycosyltransferase involved in cell wall biosynthesis